MSQNEAYWIWLQAAVGQGTAIVPRLLNTFSSIEEVYGATRQEYTYFGIPERVREALCDKSLDAANRQLERSQRENGWIWTPFSSEYPDVFRQLYSPPLVIYGKGTPPDFGRMPCIGMVGTRKCSDYGYKVAGSFSAGMAAVGCSIISGGAVGVDRAAHEGALYAGGVTVAIQSCGLDVEYPLPNRQLRRDILDAGGAVISEYPYGTTTTPSTFYVRNRLISGLSWGVCIVEAPQPSGALITARLARDQGKDVFAVPGEITSSLSCGSNALLKDGATMVLTPMDILYEYEQRCALSFDVEEMENAQKAYEDYFDNVIAPARISKKKENKQGKHKREHRTTEKTVVSGASALLAPPVGLSESCRRVYEALNETPLSAEDLFTALQMPLGEIFSVLTELEIYGCIRSHPGQQYSR